MDIGSAVSRDAGVEAAKLEALAEHATSPVYSELERLVLRLADALARTPANVPDELYAALRAHLDEGQLLELSSAIAWEHYRGRFNRVFDFGSDHFAEGAFCAVPARALPPLQEVAAREDHHG
jgi:alkylhydroperoxidase family enzyme